MTDDQWLRAMERYSNDDEENMEHSEISGGALQLSRGLEALVKNEPARSRGWRTEWTTLCTHSISRRFYAD